MTAARKTVLDALLKIANHPRHLFLTLALTILIGTLVYFALEPYTLTQSLEWAVQSATSVGYGNYTATTTAGSLFSSLYMLWGVGVMLTLLTAFVVNALRVDPNVFTDAEQNEILSYVREQRAEKELEKRRNTITVPPSNHLLGATLDGSPARPLS